MTLTETDSEQKEYRCFGQQKLEGRKGVRVRTINSRLILVHVVSTYVKKHAFAVAMCIYPVIPKDVSDMFEGN